MVLEKLNRNDAISTAKRMCDAWTIAKENLEKAQARMSASKDQHRRGVNWDIGDKVYLSTRNLKNLRPSRKLAEQWEGPYEVLEQVGHSYRLRLPPGSQIHDVFAPDVLKKDPDNPLPGQENPKPHGEAIAGEQEWEIDKILGARLVRQTLKYKVSWVGHDSDPNWYRASNLAGAPHKLRDFHQANPDRPGPPRLLEQWLQAWEAGVEDLSHLQDDRA